MTQNQIRYLQLLEDTRANQAKETELNRSNLENERLARERLSYEKYGKSQLGQGIQAVKAAGSDVATVVTPAATAVVRTITGSDPTTNPVTGETLTNPVNPTRDSSMVSHSEGNAPGAFDYKTQVSSDSFKSKSVGELADYWIKNSKTMSDSQKNTLRNELIFHKRLTWDQIRQLFIGL